VAVLGVLSVALEVPEVEAGIRFYSDAGLVGTSDGTVARFRCETEKRDSIVLLGGTAAKRLHHIQLRADCLDETVRRVRARGGDTVSAPPGFEDEDAWIRDPHGMLIHLSESESDSPPTSQVAFAINAPGRIVRAGRAGILSRASYGPVRPLRLGHVLVFTPNVSESVAFMTEALGMGLADRAQEIIAFCCAKRHSEHHVVAFAKSSSIGFHHASFQVSDPDAVGRAGYALRERTGGGGWGLGRHTIGSNFFYYIQDPWGSWFEYYCDIDYIEDYGEWMPTNYGLEDSLANWGPEVPADFVHNYES
jgi:catechol 2,3-dioxygenase-like lactoylglutathione lyase family enzyme